MGIALLIVTIVAVAVTGGLTLAGFRPAAPLEHFRADRVAEERFFHADARSVQAAYRQAAARAPGMRLVEQRDGLLYLDSRPTSRILGGDFGVVLVVEFTARDAGTAVRMSAQAKVWGPTKASTLSELERAVRMRAKVFGLAERVG